MTLAPPSYRLIDVPESRKDEFLAVDQLAFAFEPDPETAQLEPVAVQWDRAMAAETEDGTLAAVHASYPFALPVPGGQVPCAGLTWVGTRPDHRRRGLLTRMITAHFERSLARGEAVSALYAAEPAIYGRFGYGSANDAVRLTVPRGAALRDVAGSEALSVRFERLDQAVHTPLIRAVHAAAGAGRPGWVLRETDLLNAEHLFDSPSARRGAEPLSLLTVRAGQDVRGYALLRRKDDPSSYMFAKTVAVKEVAALDAAAVHRLWSVLLDLDLTTSVETPWLAIDDALVSLLVDVRATRPRVVDNLWVRLLDVRQALAARRYAAPLDLVIEVTDERLAANQGLWRVRTGAQGPDGSWPAEVVPTQGHADLVVDVRELGAAYLGGRSLAAFAHAGLIEERRPGAAQAAAAAFAWPDAPLCSWMF